MLSLLVGRARELDALEQLLDGALLGQGGLRVVSGAPGIGKTRLADELSARATARSFTVAWGRAWETGGAPAYWPWIELLTPLAAARAERFFRSGYIGNLMQSWIPALDGVTAKLIAGAKVADVGCGVGASTILMAQAFPNSHFHGFDYHAGSIELAQKRAKAAGVADRVTFSVAKSTDFPGKDYDLVACFDCLHDMEDPTGAAKLEARL